MPGRAAAKSGSVSQTSGAARRHPSITVSLYDLSIDEAPHVGCDRIPEMPGGDSSRHSRGLAACASAEGPGPAVSDVLLEVTRRVMRQRGEDEALQVAAVLHQAQVVPLDSAIALSAAQLGRAHELPLDDRIIYATARQDGATVWTLDADVSRLAGVRYFAKRKSG